MIKMVITDLDGTLLNSEQKVSERNYSSLLALGEMEVIRCIATGRSPFSFSRVIPDDFPIDYLIYSSGSGLMNWSTKEVVLNYSLDAPTVKRIVEILVNEAVSFKILEPAPRNHHFVFYENGSLHPDFSRRMQAYRGYETPLVFDPPNFKEASQVLIILPPDPDEFHRLKQRFTGVKVVRATSPMDHSSIWMEIFHPDVSKGNASAFLCNKLNINRLETIGIGNDYNDIDLLSFTGRSFVVGNAPQELHQSNELVASNTDDGFSDALIRAGIL